MFDELYDRVSTGVHADVSPAEAEAILVEAYVLLGEVLDLAPPPPPPAPGEPAGGDSFAQSGQQVHAATELDPVPEEKFAALDAR